MEIQFKHFPREIIGLLPAQRPKTVSVRAKNEGIIIIIVVVDHRRRLKYKTAQNSAPVFFGLLPSVKLL
jgi:prolyl-tRNA editing enzyme YbaK/EbsC (Cys-tRNA(Pro) deacylase)